MAFFPFLMVFSFSLMMMDFFNKKYFGCGISYFGWGYVKRMKT